MMMRIRPTPLPKVLKMCIECDTVAEHYQNRAECCRCYNAKQKRYRAEYSGPEQARALKQRHAEYQAAYQKAYYQQNRERILAQRKGARA